MPTSAMQTWSGNQKLTPAFPGVPHPQIDVALKASTTYAKGTILGEVTATPGTYGPYASGNVDGTQNPAVILRYACITDASGNITLGSSVTAGSGEWGATYKAVPAFMGGSFYTADLTGLDANAVTKLGGLLTEGSVTAGIFSF